MSKLSIKVKIAGRTYPLTVSKEEEEIVRKSAAKINSNIDSLKDNYAVKDIQDLLAMTALQFVSERVSNDNSIEFDKLTNAIVELNNELKDITI
jgi:cell division protein ZapA (FtsZ GTPase activity inhibitor)